MRKILLLTIIFLSCNKERKPNVELPLNSATLLLRAQNLRNNITSSSPLNIDIINGFRGLKLYKDIDSLYLKDWNLDKFSDEIEYYENNILLSLDNYAFDCKLYLTFYQKKLLMIDIEFDDNRDLDNDNYLREQAYDLDFIPKLLEQYEIIFGEPNKNYSYELLDEKELSRNELNNYLSDDLNAGLATYIKGKLKLVERTYEMFPNTDFEKNSFELIKGSKQILTSEKDKKNSYYFSNVYYPFIDKRILYSYSGNYTNLKLLVENKWEITGDSEKELSVTYKLKNINVKIKVYGNKRIKEYTSSKARQDSIANYQQRLIFKRNKEIKDSIKLKESLRNF